MRQPLVSAFSYLVPKKPDQGIYKGQSLMLIIPFKNILYIAATESIVSSMCWSITLLKIANVGLFSQLTVG